MAPLITYAKPALTVDDQLAQLEMRGMAFTDKAAAKQWLYRVSYFRLSGYWYPFRKFDGATGARFDDFQPGVSFEEIVRLYEFDRNLRRELLEAIEVVEVAVRMRFTYHVSHTLDPFGHCDAVNFNPGVMHADWLQRVDEEVTRSHDKFVAHFKTKYDGHPRLPIWMTTEVISFGSLSRALQMIDSAVQQDVAGAFGVHKKVIVNWVHALSVVRNICAHHARVWNRELGVTFKAPDKDPAWNTVTPQAKSRLFGTLLVLRHLLRSLGDGKAWAQRIEQLVDPIAKERQNRISMGLPPDWMKHPIWI